MELFRQPSVLIWTLAASAVLAAIMVLGAKKRASFVSAISSGKLLAKLTPPETGTLRTWKAFLFLASLFLLFLSWAGPQWGVELAARQSQAGQVIVALDTSLSMLAQDIKPSRLENAKSMIAMLVDQLAGNRMGIVAFSGKADIQCPVTTDPDALKYFISTIHNGMIAESGTSIADAVELTVKMLSRYPGRKALILLTDGEDHNSNLTAAIKDAAETGIGIIAVGIGSPEGELIPLKTEGGAVNEYKKDKEGKTVVTKLGEKTLIELAARTGGAYIRYTEPESVATEISKQLKNLEKSKWKATSRARYKNRFQIPLLLAILLLLIELFIPERYVNFRELLRFASKTAGNKNV